MFESGRQRLVVATEPFDDAGARLRNDAYRAADDEQYEYRDHDERNECRTHELLRSIDQGGCALDLHDVDRRPGFKNLVFHVRARGPDLAADLHLTVVGVNPLEHERTLAHQRIDAALQFSRCTQM